MNTQQQEKTLIKAKFDFYQATIDDDHQKVTETLAIGLAADDVEMSGGLHGYTRRASIKRGDHVVASVLSGGANGNPSAWASGEDTEPFVHLVRAVWGDSHRVSRMDSAMDFDGTGSWDRLYTKATTIADESKLKTSVAGDWIGREDGRTLYVGSRKSPSFVRLYEKGLQLRKDAPPEIVATLSTDWVRLENQVRPQRESRSKAATATPAEVFGYARFTQKLAAQCADLEVARVPIREWTEGDDARAYRYGVKQYGNTFARMVAASGVSWAEFGVQLGLDIEKERSGDGV
jgi:hypothetical protein